ncbi:MAG TPA: SAM-dependent methyltransferase [Candidatus Udaeobacter sp.]|jgi:SAM-dependent MidA family methyltransferase
MERWRLNNRNENPVLIGLIRDEIEKHGPVSFAWFMEQALYHPEHGYYSSGRCSIGRKGDYYTNVSVGSLFGRLLAAQFGEIWEQLGRIDDFVIVEQGAHDGQFARDVIESAQSRAPEFFEALRYRIVEPFPSLRERQLQMLEPFQDKIEWWTSLAPFTGVHFSNELLDAMPVRFVGAGVEKLVDLQGDNFVFIDRPISHTPLNQAALDWIETVATNLERGYLIAIDYGYFAEQFQGNIQIRAEHRYLDSPFQQIGQADITMHVDWTSIVERAEEHGLRVAGFTDQHHFLTGIISTWPDLLRDSSLSSANVNRASKPALHTLLHPEMLGRAFQVLSVVKNVDPGAPQLAGLKFARK